MSPVLVTARRLPRVNLSPPLRPWGKAREEAHCTLHDLGIIVRMGDCSLPDVFGIFNFDLG